MTSLSILSFLFFALLVVLVVLAIGEARVAQPRADRQHAPAIHILHERNFGETLHYAVIMHQDRGVVFADLWNAFDQARRQIEPAALPIARQVLRALFDRAVLLDDAGTGDADERRKFQPFGIGFGYQILAHLDQPLDRAFARRLVVGMPPQLGFPHLGPGKILRLLPARLHHAATDIGAADIDREDAVVGLKNPGWRQMQRTEQAGIVGVKTDRHQIDLEVVVLENDLGPGDRELAEPAFAKSAADHDTLGLRPGLGLEEAARHIGQLLRKILDRAVQDRGSLQIVADQDGVECLLVDLVRRFVAERVLAGFSQLLSPFIENRAKRALAGAVANKTVLVLQLDIKAVHVYGRQPGRAVAGDARGHYDVFGHGWPCPVGN